VHPRTDKVNLFKYIFHCCSSEDVFVRAAKAKWSIRAASTLPRWSHSAWRTHIHVRAHKLPFNLPTAVRSRGFAKNRCPHAARAARRDGRSGTATPRSPLWHWRLETSALGPALPQLPHQSGKRRLAEKWRLKKLRTCIPRARSAHGATRIKTSQFAASRIVSQCKLKAAGSLRRTPLDLPTARRAPSVYSWQLRR
jgi:hypothetical protein